MRLIISIGLILLIAFNSSGQKSSVATKQFESKKEKQDDDGFDFKGQLDTMLGKAMHYAKNHKKESSFKKVIRCYNYSPQCAITLVYGYLFDTGHKHLIIKRKLFDNLVYVDIYLLENASFKLLCSNKRHDSDYIGTMIKDINGDGQKDFMVKLYSSSGCCMRNVFQVYLYRSSTGSFSEMYEFMNPTFSPSEKIVRGVDYGQPGDCALYKYKWHGYKLDTIQFIFPDKTGRKYYTATRSVDLRNFDKSKPIKTVPAEYYSIAGYDWFLGKY